MKILFINCPGRRQSGKMLNLGLAYLSASIKMHFTDVSVSLLDFAVNPVATVNIEAELLVNRNCDVFAISADITSYLFVKAIIAQLRRIKANALIIVGGGLASSVPVLALNRLHADYVFIGESEENILYFLEDVKSKRSCKSTKGIYDAEKLKGNVFIEKGYLPDLNVLAMPDRDLFHVKKYIENQDRSEIPPFGTLVGSRGCVFQCAFCDRNYRGDYRVRSPQDIVDEMIYLESKYRYEHLAFLDELLIFNEDHVASLCEMLVRSRAHFTWEANGKPGYLSDRVLKSLSDAKCIRLGLGIESGSEKILKRMKKSTSPEQIEETVARIDRYGIEPMMSFIIGYPGENAESIEATKNLCLRIKKYTQRPIIFNYLQVYPGTILFAEHFRNISETQLENYVILLGDSNRLNVNLTHFSTSELAAIKIGLEKQINQC